MPRRKKADIWGQAGHWGDRPSPNQKKFALKMDAELEMAFQQGVSRVKGLITDSNPQVVIAAFKAIADIWEARERLRAGRAGEGSQVPLTKGELKAELVDLLRELDPEERAQVYGLVDEVKKTVTPEEEAQAVLEDAAKLEAV